MFVMSAVREHSLLQSKLAVAEAELASRFVLFSLFSLLHTHSRLFVDKADLERVQQLRSLERTDVVSRCLFFFFIFSLCLSCRLTSWYQ